MKLQSKIFIGLVLTAMAGGVGVSFYNNGKIFGLRKAIYSDGNDPKSKSGLGVPDLSGLSSIGETGLKTNDAKLIVSFLNDMPNHGVESTDLTSFNEIFAASKRLDDNQKAQLKAILLKYAHRLNGENIDWKFLGKNWDMRPKNRDFSTELETAITNNTISDFLNSLLPNHTAYKNLLRVRPLYAKLVESGGFVKIDGAIGLKEGSDSPIIGQLRQRLAQENYNSINLSTPNLFDAALKTEVQKYQKTHGLKASGEIDAKTFASLNIDAKTRLKKIDLNLERERWLPKANPQTRIEANIPSQHLVYYENSVSRLEMPTIVGKVSTKTPIFTSEVHGVVFNPPWYKPASIRGRVRVQKPGPMNSLGRVKFDLKNNHSVFLHDTPNHGLFSVANRTFSHGCVRLHYPKDLAAILTAPEGYTREKIDEITNTLNTKYVKLKTKTPVYILYRTVSVADTGELAGLVQFHNDPYKWDELLEIALDPTKKAQLAKIASGDKANPAAP